MNIQGDILPGSSGLSLGSSSSRWLLNGTVRDIIELTVALESEDGETKTVSNSAITSNHVVLEDITEYNVGYIIGQTITEVPAGDIQWQTGNGTITLTCNMINTSEITTETTTPAVITLRLGVIG